MFSNAQDGHPELSSIFTTSAGLGSKLDIEPMVSWTDTLEVLRFLKQHRAAHRNYVPYQDEQGNSLAHLAALYNNVQLCIFLSNLEHRINKRGQAPQALLQCSSIVFQAVLKDIGNHLDLLCQLENEHNFRRWMELSEYERKVLITYSELKTGNDITEYVDDITALYAAKDHARTRANRIGMALAIIFTITAVILAFIYPPAAFIAAYSITTAHWISAIITLVIGGGIIAPALKAAATRTARCCEPQILGFSEPFDTLFTPPQSYALVGSHSLAPVTTHRVDASDPLPFGSFESPQKEEVQEISALPQTSAAYTSPSPMV